MAGDGEPGGAGAGGGKGARAATGPGPGAPAPGKGAGAKRKGAEIAPEGSLGAMMRQVAGQVVVEGGLQGSLKPKAERRKKRAGKKRG